MPTPRPFRFVATNLRGVPLAPSLDALREIVKAAGSRKVGKVPKKVMVHRDGGGLFEQTFWVDPAQSSPNAKPTGLQVVGHRAPNKEQAGLFDLLTPEDVRAPHAAAGTAPVAIASLKADTQNHGHARINTQPSLDFGAESADAPAVHQPSPVQGTGKGGHAPAGSRPSGAPGAKPRGDFGTNNGLFADGRGEHSVPAVPDRQPGRDHVAPAPKATTPPPAPAATPAKPKPPVARDVPPTAPKPAPTPKPEPLPELQPAIDFAAEVPEVAAPAQVPTPTAVESLAPAVPSVEVSSRVGEDLPDVEPGFVPRDLKRQTIAAANDADFVLTPEMGIGTGSLAQKAADNFAAIDLLKELETSGREPSEAEKQVLARYVGWGAFGQAFQPKFKGTEDYHDYDAIPSWEKYRWSEADRAHWQVYRTVRDKMTEDEYEAAWNSTQNAHYTAPKVVSAMWEAVRHLGYTGGRVLEPAMGSGNFFGFQPEDLRRASLRTGVELDPLTGRIAKYLYPASNIHITGFQDAPIADNVFDVAISNVPFGKIAVYDPKFELDGRKFLTGSIHNYFFSKALDKVRPGGIVAFVTSHHTLDAPTSKGVRKHLADRAHFLGAVRLPNDAFAGNAGTKVTTDIIFLQKKDPLFEALHPRDAQGRFIEKWDETVTVEVDSNMGPQEIQLNRYFADHPEMMLGKMGVGSGYGLMSKDDTGMKSDGRDLEQALQMALNQLPKDILHQAVNPQQVEEAASAERAASHFKDGAFLIKDGKLCRNIGGLVKPVPDVPATTLERCKGMIAVRDAMQQLINAERNGLPDEEVEDARKALNKAYYDFVEKHGNLRTAVNQRAFMDDPDAQSLLALETVTVTEWEETVKGKTVKKRSESYGKSDMFTKRTISPLQGAVSASSPTDALGIVLNEKGYLDFARMSELLNRDPESIRDDLSDMNLIYQDPAQMGDPRHHGWVTADEFLSGNVREKLETARQWAAAPVEHSFPTAAKNLAALEVNQPAELAPGDIELNLGATWIPPKYIDQFIDHLIGPSHSKMASYNETLDQWTLGDPDWAIMRGAKNRQEWGTEDVTAHELVGLLLNGRRPEVRYKDEDGKDVLDREATGLALEKATRIKKEFRNWWKQDMQRAIDLADTYNRLFNHSIVRQYDGSHVTWPGMNPAIAASRFPHIKDACWRAVQAGRALFDHVVGMGKTSVAISTAMELRRLGLARKPMIMVPNKNMAQWDNDAREMYPGAKILTVWQKHWTPARRRELVATIATGDWDMVLITHSAFSMLSLKQDTLQDYFGEQITQMENALEELGYDRDVDPTKMGRVYGDPEGAANARTAKQIAQMRANMKTKLTARLAKAERNKDKGMDWEDLGVDAVLTDEWDMCFPHSTPVLTDRGPLPIGEIVEGKLPVNVLSFDKATHLYEWKPVTNWIKRPLLRKLVRVVHTRGEFICTENHQIWADDSGYIDAGALVPGARLRAYTSGPDLSSVLRVEAVGVDVLTPADRAGEIPTVYDLSVADNHNYIAAGVLVSNSYKNLPFVTKSDSVAGLSPTGSDRALDYYIKVRSMMKKNNWRGLYLLTATPISNTMAEMFTLKRTLFSPDELTKYGIQTFDRWKSLFGDVQTTLEPAPEGGHKLRDRFGHFVNAPEMIKLYRTIADVKTMADAPGVLARLPIIEGGQSEAVLCPLSDRQKSYFAWIRKRADDITDGVVKDPSLDNFLNILNDGRKATLDIRTVDPDGEDHETSKANVCAQRIYEIYKDSHDYKGTQCVFLDLSTPRVDSSQITGDSLQTAVEKAQELAEGETDPETMAALAVPEDEDNIRVYEELKKKLIAKGIPANEIAFAHDFNTDRKCADRDRDMNSGKVRVLIGSTAKMGAGLNIQSRLVALHHMDCPHRPRDVDQRDGRMIRQGNLHRAGRAALIGSLTGDDSWQSLPEDHEHRQPLPVKILRYVSKGSMDEFQWNGIAKKQHFINQAKSGDLSVRNIEDIDELALNDAKSVQAACSANPLVRERQGLEMEIASLIAASNAHATAAIRAAREAAAIPGQIEETRKGIEINRAMAERLDAAAKEWEAAAPKKPEDFTMQVMQRDGSWQSIGKRETAGMALIAAHADKTRHAAQGVSELIGKIGPFGVYATKDPNGNNPFCAEIKDAQGRVIGNIDAGTSPAGQIQKLENALRQLRDRASQTRGKVSAHEALIKNLEAQKPQFEEQAKKTFDRTGYLEEKQARLAEVEKILASDTTQQEEDKHSYDYGYGIHLLHRAKEARDKKKDQKENAKVEKLRLTAVRLIEKRDAENDTTWEARLTPEQRTLLASYRNGHAQMRNPEPGQTPESMADAYFQLRDALMQKVNARPVQKFANVLVGGRQVRCRVLKA